MAVKVITYDVGTTGMKACMFDISAEDSVRYVAGETEGYELHVLKNGGVEQEPDDWWQSMADCHEKAARENGRCKGGNQRDFFLLSVSDGRHGR